VIKIYLIIYLNIIKLLVEIQMSTIKAIDNELQYCANMSQVMQHIINKPGFVFTFDDYMKYINNRFKPEMDISFIDYFMEMCDNENEFIIDHTKLHDYGIITNVKTSNNILKCLKKNSLIENDDYRVLLQAQPVKQGGTSIKKQYILRIEI
jgi:hypothetical protein